MRYSLSDNSVSIFLSYYSKVNPILKTYNKSERESSRVPFNVRPREINVYLRYVFLIS